MSDEEILKMAAIAGVLPDCPESAAAFCLFARALRFTVIDECAMWCDAQIPTFERFDGQIAAGNTARACASLIRAMKAKP